MPEKSPISTIKRFFNKLPRPERSRYSPSSLHEGADTPELGSMCSLSRIHPQTKNTRSSASEYGVENSLEKHGAKILIFCLFSVSIVTFVHFYQTGLGLTYNDARSHLDIGRRVVEGLTPGLAQLGSVWLPLPHLLLILTVWNDFMWHSGLAGALISMISYVFSGLFIWLILKRLAVSPLPRLIGVAIFAANANILYLQSTAMTELLLLLTLTGAIYEIIAWSQNRNDYSIVKGAFWVMLATLIRYEGWFLFIVAAVLIWLYTAREKGKKAAEGMLILFTTLSGFGIFLWFFWNKLIFGDFFYFIFGPYSAHAQQEQLQIAGDLLTKGNFLFSAKIYYFAVYYCIGLITVVAAILGATLISLDKKLSLKIRMAALVLLISPVVFNVLALYLGHSVVFIEGLSGKSWFNVRYGVMALPAAAVFSAYLIDKSKQMKYVLTAVFVAVIGYSVLTLDSAVTIADAKYGSSGRDVSQVAGWLKNDIKDDHQSRVLIAAASHDALIFSSGLPMKQIIHEGTGPFWESATQTPDKWAKYIVMRTYDTNDSAWNSLKDNKYALEKYEIAYKGIFADIYKLRPEYESHLANDFSPTAFDFSEEKITRKK